MTISTTSRSALTKTATPLLSSLVLAALAAPLGAGCAASSPLSASLEPMRYEAPAPPPELTQNHFKRDIMGDVDEAQLREILAAPVYLEEKSRIGILPVSEGYDVDADIPTGAIPGALEKALEESGQFEVVSEVTTDWPHASGTIGGLRELAARYRAEYLLLTRNRFVTRSHANGWAVTWLTLVGGLVFPHRTIEVAGVVEATLLDVKTGTLLFTAYERVHDQSMENVWQNERKRADMKTRLLGKATKAITEKVLDQVRRLVAARPARPVPTASAPRPVPAAVAAPAPTASAVGSESASPDAR